MSDSQLDSYVHSLAVPPGTFLVGLGYVKLNLSRRRVHPKLPSNTSSTCSSMTSTRPPPLNTKPVLPWPTAFVPDRLLILIESHYGHLANTGKGLGNRLTLLEVTLPDAQFTFYETLKAPTQNRITAYRRLKSEIREYIAQNVNQSVPSPPTAFCYLDAVEGDYSLGVLLALEQRMAGLPVITKQLYLQDPQFHHDLSPEARDVKAGAKVNEELNRVQQKLSSF